MNWQWDFVTVLALFGSAIAIVMLAAALNKWRRDWRWLHKKYSDLCEKAYKAKCLKCGCARIGMFCSKCGSSRLEQLPPGSRFAGMEDDELVFFVPGREAEFEKHLTSAAFSAATPRKPDVTDWAGHSYSPFDSH